MDVVNYSEQKIHFVMMFNMAREVVSETDISQTENLFCDVSKNPVHHEETVLNSRKKASFSVDESTKSYSSIILNSLEKDISPDKFFPHLNRNVLSSASLHLNLVLRQIFLLSQYKIAY